MIVGIVAAGGSGVQSIEEFRAAPDESSAVERFCAEHQPPLAVTDYMGVNSGFDDDVVVSLPWAYDFNLSVLVEDLDLIKSEKVLAIKAHREWRRQNVIFAEMPPASSKMFNTSPAAQSNWIGLETLDRKGAVVYPFTVTTRDELDSHDIPDSATLQTFVLIVAASIMAERDLAQASMDAVNAAINSGGVTSAAEGYLSLTT